MFDDLVELADAEETHLYDVEREQIAEMYVQAVEMARYGREALAKLTAHIADRFDEPMVLSNGWILRPTTEDKRTKWNKPALATAAFNEHGRWLIDPETSERVFAIQPEYVGKFFEPATGRTRTWRELVDIDEYSNVERDQPAVEVIKP